jgi:GntR family transcriptional regulator
MGSEQGGRELDRESALPLWAQLYEDLRSRLEMGHFTTSFPSEMELVEQYRVSRNTVREAMRRLRAEGFVVAARGRRPHLVADAIEQPLGALYSLFASVEASGLEQRSEVRSLRVDKSPHVAGQLGLAPGTSLVYLERLRLAGGEPLALDRVWVPAAIGSALLEADFSHTSLYNELRQRCGIVVNSGREQIRAIVPAEAERGILRLPTTAAVLSIERLGCSQGQPVEWRHTLLRGDRFSVVAEFSPLQGYQFDVGAFPAQGP